MCQIVYLISDVYKHIQCTCMYIHVCKVHFLSFDCESMDSLEKIYVGLAKIIIAFFQYRND